MVSGTPVSELSCGTGLSPQSGPPLPAARFASWYTVSTQPASPATVGDSSRVSAGRSTSNRSFTRPSTSGISTELPPSSKKAASTPSRARPGRGREGGRPPRRGGQVAQRRPGPPLQQHAAARRHQAGKLPDPVRETNGSAGLPRPVQRIGGLLPGDPRAGQVGQQRY